LLAFEEDASGDICQHVAFGEAPFGGVAIHDLDHGHEAQGGQGADERGGAGADPAPAEQVILECGNIIGGSGMTDLIDLEPFGVVVEKMEFGMREFFVPEILETDRDGCSEGGLADDDSVNAAGVVSGGCFEEILRPERDG